MSEIVEAISALGTATEQLKDAKESFENIRQDADQSINDVNANFAEKAASLTIVATDGYRKAIEDASGGRNTVIYDAQGNPNIMVVIPRFNVEDLGLDALNLGSGTHPAFKTNGADRGEILIAKYLASEGESGGCSVVGGVQPKTTVTYDCAKELCTQKGDGWHMMSIHEWAAISLWSLANGTIPRGNTNYGRSHEKKWETATRLDLSAPGETGGTPRTDTGKGPLSWSHDHSEFGIHDLVGNVWEWLDQMKIEEGQIITTIDNNPDLVEASWFSHSAFFTSPNDSQDGTGVAGSPILSSSVINRTGPIGNDENNNPYLMNILFDIIEKDISYVPSQLLRQLLLESESDTGLSGSISVRNYGERFPRRGGFWSSGNDAGLGALYLAYSRENAGSSFGFRPAYFV